jgi:hypothetical protein
MKQAGIFFIALLWLASSCQKEDMPPSDGHENIFRCKVNGEEWTPHCISDFFGCSAIDCQYYVVDGVLGISVIRRYEDDSADEYIGMDIRGAIIGDNILRQSSGYEYANGLKVFPCGYYDLDTLKIHKFTIINIDTIKHTIEGTFEYSAYDRNGSCADTVYITDGYFDIVYRF